MSSGSQLKQVLATSSSALGYSPYSSATLVDSSYMAVQQSSPTCTKKTKSRKTYTKSSKTSKQKRTYDAVQTNPTEPVASIPKPQYPGQQYRTYINNNLPVLNPVPHLSFPGDNDAEYRTIAALERIVLRNPHSNAVYSVLIRTPGLTALEVLKVIQANPLETDVSMLYMYIVSAREMNAAADREAMQKLSEDADYDRAVLMSEGDRDFEENRKKQRLADLKHDCSIPILSAAEFQSSLLLGFVHERSSSSQATPSSSSSSSTVRETQGQQHLSLWIGSKTLQNIISELVKKHGNDKASVTCICLDDDTVEGLFTPNQCVVCTPSLKKLREYIVRLLLVERDAIRFYQTISYPYIQLLAELIDETLNFGDMLSPPSQQNVQISENSRTRKRKRATSRGANTGTEKNAADAQCSSAVIDQIDQIDQNLLAKLDKYTNKFEFDLYRIAGASSAAPIAFLQAEEELVSSGRMKPTLSLDSDGVEIINNDMKSQDDKKNAESWSDMSDYESD